MAVRTHRDRLRSCEGTVPERAPSGRSTGGPSVRAPRRPVIRPGAPCGGLAGALLIALGLVGAAAAQGADYRLAPGDRISLSVYGQTELSGEFGVGGGGSLFLPLVGEVPVSDMTLQDAQKAITDRLADGFLRQPAVTLRIAEMRPIYVMGDVRTPGSYPFRYGSSVLSGIALAGGFGLPEQARTNLRTEFLAADERMRVLEATRRLFLVRRARLEAQKQNRDTFEIAINARGDSGLDRIVAEEREMLVTQRNALVRAIEALRAQKPRLEAEIAGVKAQRAAEEAQLALIQAHIADYQKLMADGLGRRYQGIEFQREEARNKGSIARMASDLAHLDLALGDLTLRIQETRDAYDRKIMSELQDVTTRLVEVEMQLPIAREVREARLASGAAPTPLAAGDPMLKIFITRAQHGAAETFEAAASTPLAPGDIIDIRREPTSRGLQSNAQVIDGAPIRTVSDARP